jgi:hypothetical protein
MPSPQFTTSDITRIFGLKIERQKNWLKEGYIEPSIRKADGHGTKNIFSLEDLYFIALFQHLIQKNGFARGQAAVRVKLIRNLHNIAKGAHRMRLTRLNTAGINQIKEEWANLDAIEFVVVGYVEDPQKALAYHNLSKTRAIRSVPPGEKIRIEVDPKEYAEVEEINVIHFRKIREFVDSAVKKL